MRLNSKLLAVLSITNIVLWKFREKKHTKINVLSSRSRRRRWSCPVKGTVLVTQVWWSTLELTIPSLVKPVLLSEIELSATLAARNHITPQSTPSLTSLTTVSGNRRTDSPWPSSKRHGIWTSSYDTTWPRTSPQTTQPWGTGTWLHRQLWTLKQRDGEEMGNPPHKKLSVVCNISHGNERKVDGTPYRCRQMYKANIRKRDNLTR